MDVSRGVTREDERGPDQAISVHLILKTDFPGLVLLVSLLFPTSLSLHPVLHTDTVSITPEAAYKRWGGGRNCIVFGHIHNHRKETPGKVLG